MLFELNCCIIFVIRDGELNMSNTKFNDFFYEGELIQLTDALTDDGTLLDCYDRFSLYCPYCQSVRLKFYSQTSQKNAYLATWPGDVHPEECPASFTPAKKKELTNYYEKLSPEQVQDKLNIYMRRYTSKENFNLPKAGANTTRITSATSNSVSNTKKYILPQKSLSSPLTQIDDNLRNLPIVFYGKAYVEFTLSKNSKFNQIHLKRESNKKLFLYMENGLSKLNIPENFDANILYTVVFIGIYDTGAKFPRLINYGAFLLEPTKDQ